MACFLVTHMGCGEAKTSKGFSHTMEDGSRVVIKIEYKPKGVLYEDKKIGVYYYIVQHFSTTYSNVGIRFYDRSGYSLFNDARGTFAPGWSTNADETNRIDGGWEWKGRFTEDDLTLENFREIHSIDVRTIKR